MSRCEPTLACIACNAYIRRDASGRLRCAGRPVTIDRERTRGQLLPCGKIARGLCARWRSTGRMAASQLPTAAFSPGLICPSSDDAIDSPPAEYIQYCGMVYPPKMEPMHVISVSPAAWCIEVTLLCIDCRASFTGGADSQAHPHPPRLLVFS